MSMALLVIIGHLAVFAVVILAAMESKRIDRNQPSILDFKKADNNPEEN